MSSRGLRPVRGLALGLVVALATSGCVAAGLAGGPLISAVQLIGDRTVERTVAAELAEALGATEAVLTRMAFRIEDRQREEGVQRLRAVADEVTVHVKLERVTTKLTRLGFRVEAGGLRADRDTGTQIHEQVAAALAPAPPRAPVSEPVAAETLTTLQGEIRKLRSDIEARRAAERPASAGENRTSMRLEPGAIVTIPMSAALPTLGGPAPPVSVPAPATASATVQPIEPVPGRREPAPGTLEARTAPLRPAGALTPILPATGVGSGR